MLIERPQGKGRNQKVFQVLWLNNDVSQDVEVQDTEQVDFFRIEEHLKQGGSIFITSKHSQKIVPPRAKKRAIENSGLRTVKAVYFANTRRNHLIKKFSFENDLKNAAYKALG